MMRQIVTSCIIAANLRPPASSFQYNINDFHCLPLAEYFILALGRGDNGQRYIEGNKYLNINIFLNKYISNILIYIKLTSYLGNIPSNLKELKKSKKINS